MHRMYKMILGSNSIVCVVASRDGDDIAGGSLHAAPYLNSQHLRHQVACVERALFAVTLSSYSAGDPEAEVDRVRRRPAPRW